MDSPDVIPSDDTLTDEGARLTGPDGRILLIACGALAREILAVIRANGWDHMDLVCLPAIYHNHPETITDAVEAAVEKQRPKYEHINVVYADCGTGGQLFEKCKKLGVEMVKGPHCYSFFEGNEIFAVTSENE